MVVCMYLFIYNNAAHFRLPSSMIVNPPSILSWKQSLQSFVGMLVYNTNYNA